MLVKSFKKRHAENSKSNSNFPGIEVIYGDQNRSSFNNLSKFRDDSSSGNGVNVYSPAKAEEQLRRGYANNGTLSRMKAASEVEGK